MARHLHAKIIHTLNHDIENCDYMHVGLLDPAHTHRIQKEEQQLDIDNFNNFEFDSRR